MKIIYALGVNGIVDDNGQNFSYYEHYYDNKIEANKALYYYQYVLNRKNAFLDEIEIEDSFDNEIPSKMYVEARFNYRNTKCRYDHINLNIHPKVFSIPKEMFEKEEIKVLKSDRCGVRSSNVSVYFIIKTDDTETREDLENRCIERVKELYDHYLKGDE